MILSALSVGDVRQYDLLPLAFSESLSGKLYHTGTMTMQSEGLNERAPECFGEISPRNAQQLDLENGMRLTVASRRRTIEAIILTIRRSFT